MLDMNKTMSHFKDSDDYYKSIIADLKSAPIYVVHAMRWGDCEKHSYIVTATLNKVDALSVAEIEEQERGGKYGCEVSRFNCGEKTVIRKPYDDKPTCYTCEYGKQRTGLICQGCTTPKQSNYSISATQALLPQ